MSKQLEILASFSSLDTISFSWHTLNAAGTNLDIHKGSAPKAELREALERVKEEAGERLRGIFITKL